MTTSAPASCVYIVEDDDLARESLCALISSMGIAHQAFESGERFLECCDETFCGCVVTDLRLKGMNGIELQEQAMRRGITLPFIIVTAFAATNLTVRAMKNGAVTLLEKPYDTQQLWDAVQTALAENQKNRHEGLARREMTERFSALTEGEKQVLDLVVKGLPNKNIAYDLNVSLRTVEARKHSLMKKMRVGSNAELIAMALALKETQAVSS